MISVSSQAVNDKKNELFHKARNAYRAQKAQYLAVKEELQKVKGELAAATAQPAVVDKLQVELQGLKQQLAKAQSKLLVLRLFCCFCCTFRSQLTCVFAQPTSSKSPS